MSGIICSRNLHLLIYIYAWPPPATDNVDALLRLLSNRLLTNIAWLSCWMRDQQSEVHAQLHGWVEMNVARTNKVAEVHGNFVSVEPCFGDRKQDLPFIFNC